GSADLAVAAGGFVSAGADFPFSAAITGGTWTSFDFVDRDDPRLTSSLVRVRVLLNSPRRTRSLRAASAMFWASAETVINRTRINAFMSRIILLGCRSCEGEIRLTPTITNEVRCPHCQTNVPVRVGPALLQEGVVRNCVGCGHDNLY